MYSCSTAIKRPIIHNLSFALIGNTCPESPFKPIFPDADKLVQSINMDNPSFIIHTGNIVYAAAPVALRDTDIKSQFDSFTNAFAALEPVRQYVPGDLDLFAGSTSLYQEFTGKSEWYTFRVGQTCFIVLNSTNPAPCEIGSNQRQWLEEQLSHTTEGAAVIILSHHPFFVSKSSEPTIKSADSFHQLFKKYNVFAVISGAGETLSRVEKDSITYINAGTLPLYKRDSYDKFRYYTVEIISDMIILQGKKW